MRFSSSLIVYGTCLAAMGAQAGSQTSPDAKSTDSPGLSVAFTVSQSTAVPGADLKAGQYSLQIVDHLTDRTIVRVLDSRGKERATFLAVPTAELARTAAGPVEWQRGGAQRHALRGFSFPGGNALEFVYPKSEAAAIAQKNAAEVPAIDPAGDSSKLANKRLSQQDLQMVTLWSLEETRVGPNDKIAAIAARPYRSQATQMTETETVTAQPPAPRPVMMASNRTPAFHAAAQDTGMADTATPPTRPHRGRTRSATSPETAASQPADGGTTLPRTASGFPSLIACGLLLMMLASTLRFLRRRPVQA